MQITITVPDTLAKTVRRAARELRPDLADDLTAKQIAELITAEYWRTIVVEYAERQAELAGEASKWSTMAAARAAAVTDVAAIA